MNVKLAAQILNTTVGNTILDFEPDEAKETANFCLLMDSFFDYCNVRNTKEYMSKRKSFLEPYKYTNDERFHWLKNTFLQYFADWKNNIETRSGKYSAIEKSKMFIPYQTHEGITMTVNSLVECVQFLLGRGLPYVLTKVFCQDYLEIYFGKQRAVSCRKDNPNLRDTGHNDNIIKSQFTIRPLGGNVRQHQNKWEIDETPVPKKPRKLLHTMLDMK